MDPGACSANTDPLPGKEEVGSLVDPVGWGCFFFPSSWVAGGEVESVEEEDEVGELLTRGSPVRIHGVIVSADA